MQIHQSVCLVSGGMDSIAALCWAKRTYRDVLGVLFDYGQPNRDQELTRAGAACEALGVTRKTICVADSLPRKGILNRVEDHDGREDGSSPAIVPGRNLLFAVSAASHASAHFTNGNIALVLGCNAQDARRFPDCHSMAIKAMGECIRVSIAREIQVVAPWITGTKAAMLAALPHEDRDLVATSWSCYRGVGPCGKCSACVLRAEAFAAVGLEDKCATVQMTGGDPARENRFGIGNLA